MRVPVKLHTGETVYVWTVDAREIVAAGLGEIVDPRQPVADAEKPRKGRGGRRKQSQTQTLPEPEGTPED